MLADARREGIGTLLLRRALGHARLIGAEQLGVNDYVCTAQRAAWLRALVPND